MRHYTFKLRADAELIEDNRGMWFDNRERARDHAGEVAHELMRGQEQQTRTWRLDVYEDGVCVHELPFASIDPTLGHLRPALRATVEEASEMRRGLRDALSAARTTARESRALVARSRGKPYLATVKGEPTVREGNDRLARKRAGRNED
jgi:hypothetical protein